MIKIKLPVTCLLFFLVLAVCLKPVLAQVVEYTGRDYRNPLKIPVGLTKPIEVSEKEERRIILPVFSVQGMVWGNNRPQAIINGEVFEEGDVVQEAEIIVIDKQGITFLYQGKKFIVRPVSKSRKNRGE